MDHIGVLLYFSYIPPCIIPHLVNSMSIRLFHRLLSIIIFPPFCHHKYFFAKNLTYGHLKLETIKEMSERPETRMKSIPSRLAVDNSLNGRFGMKSEPVNYSICNAVRIADTIINNRIVMQIISDKLFLLFPQAKL